MQSSGPSQVLSFLGTWLSSQFKSLDRRQAGTFSLQFYSQSSKAKAHSHSYLVLRLLDLHFGKQVSHHVMKIVFLCFFSNRFERFKVLV